MRLYFRRKFEKYESDFMSNPSRLDLGLGYWQVDSRDGELWGYHSVASLVVSLLLHHLALSGVWSLKSILPTTKIIEKLEAKTPSKDDIIEESSPYEHLKVIPDDFFKLYFLIE